MNRKMFEGASRITGLLWLASAAVGPVAGDARAAPQEPSQLVERVVAVVGDTAILWTELQEYTIELRGQGMEVPQDPEAYRDFLEEALDWKVDEVVLYMRARREGITVSDSEVNQLIDERLALIRRQFGSDAEFQQALGGMGLSAAEFRIRMGERIQVQLINSRYLQQRIGQMQPVPVSEEEIRERFEQRKSALGPRPPTVTLKQVIITPQPSEEANLAAEEKAEQALSRLRSGEDFAQLAREYSDDPASRERGGELGWVRQGQLLPEFEETLFGMLPGAVRGPIETSVGYHIVKLERIRGPERLARHILIRLPVSDADVEAARQLAEEVAAALRAGADPDSLINKHGDPSEQSSLTRYPRDRLPQSYQDALADADPGDVVGPIFLQMTSGPGSGKWVVARISNLRPGGEWTLDDVRESFRGQIEQEKRRSKLIDDLREATYIETRLDELPMPG